MKYEITEENIEPFYAEVVGSMYGELHWNYKLDMFMTLLYSFRKHGVEGKKYLLYIGD